MALSSFCTLFLASVVAISLVQGKEPETPEEPKYITYPETCFGRLYKEGIYKYINFAPVPSGKEKGKDNQPTFLDLEPTVTWKKKEVSCGEEIDPKLLCNHPTIHLPQASVDYLKRTKNANGAYRENGRFPYFAVAIWAIGLKLTVLPTKLPATLPPDVTKTLKSLNSTIYEMTNVTYLYSLYYDIPRDILGEKKKGFDGTTDGTAKFAFEKPLPLLDLKPVLSDFKYIVQVHAQSDKYGEIKAPKSRLLFNPAELQTDLYLPVGAKFVTTHFKVDFESLLCLNITGVVKGAIPKPPKLL